MESIEIMYARDDNRKDFMDDINSFKRMYKCFYSLLSCFLGGSNLVCLLLNKTEFITYLENRQSVTTLCIKVKVS